MRNVLFSTKDPLGDDSNVVKNLYNHSDRKTNCGFWGNNEHIRKLLPRGKAYDRMLDIQFESELNNPLNF